MDEPQRPCAEVRDIAATRLAEVRAKPDELRALEAGLLAFVGSCDAACSRGPALDCTILDDLSVRGDATAATRAAGCCP